MSDLTKILNIATGLTNKLDRQEFARLLKYLTDNKSNLATVEECLRACSDDNSKLLYLRELSKASSSGKGVEEVIEGLGEFHLSDLTDYDRKIKRNKGSLFILFKVSKLKYVTNFFFFIAEYMETVKSSIDADPPSTSAKPSAFSVDQTKNPILNGRPLNLTGPPITIYDRVFSEFRENFENVNLDVSSGIYDLVTDLIYASTEFYKIEDERMDIIRGILSRQWTIDLVEYQRKAGKGRSCDGVITFKIQNKFTAYIGFIEGKNEVGSGGCDPNVQGAIYYRDYWSQNSVQQIRNRCCVPSIIITLAGPLICVLGAVFLNRVVVQPLTDTISFAVDLRHDEQVMRIARLFQALDIAFKRLHTFYGNLNLSSSEPRFFPYIKQAGSAFSFTYICELLDDHSRPVWKAKRDDDQSIIVVKFAHKYNVTAHNICANGNYAPRLLYHSSNDEYKRLGGYNMIIMEYIDGLSLAQKLRRDEIKTQNNIYVDVENAIKLLHNANLVFADLRTPNIMVVEINGYQRAKLIDFDWCGTHDIDRYPPSMNQNIAWPRGARPRALLRKDHDLAWLNDLRDDLLKNTMKSSYKYQNPITTASSSSVIPQSSASNLGKGKDKVHKICGCGCDKFSPSRFNPKECKICYHPH